MERLLSGSFRARRRRELGSLSATTSEQSRSLLSSIQLAGRGGDDNEESRILSTQQYPEEAPEENLDKVLDHCFKQFKFREVHPHAFIKVKGSRFGPAKSRRRILIAPPMTGEVPFHPRPQSGLPSSLKEKTTLPWQVIPQAEETSSTEEEDVQALTAWIEERKKLQNLLGNCVNLEKWLAAKEHVSQLEVNVLDRIKEERRLKKAKAEAKLTSVSSIDHLMPKRPRKRIVPLIKTPYPESLITLQNLLQKQRVKLVDLFAKADRSKTVKFKRADFIKIIEATKVPISKNELEDIVLYLTMSTKANCITSNDLAECQSIWLERIRDQWKNTKEPVLAKKQVKLSATIPLSPNRKVVLPASCKTAPSPGSVDQNKAKVLSPHTKWLQTPPINTEVDRRRLTYDQMEMVGKRYREMRRQLKRKVDPLDFAEQCRMVKTGDMAVDGHCLPSTMEGEMGELVDQHRLRTHLVYTRCGKLCEKYQVPITDKALKRGLLYAGDRLMREGNSFRKIRQPGGYYGKFTGSEETSDDESTSSFKAIKRKPKPIAEKKQVMDGKTLKYRWHSFEEFKNLMINRSKRLLPPPDILPDLFFYTDKTPEEVYVEKQLRKMFSYLNPLTDPNSFWPGHLLDKLCLYQPQIEGNEGDPLFSHVSRTRPVYPGIYSPDRHWPISDKGYVIYGDPESRKHNYYI